MIGEDINVPENVYLTISCSHLINQVVPFNITWRIGEHEASNGSAPNVIISQNKHQLIITSTLLSVGGQRGNRGTYTCAVCSNNGTCLERQSYCEICGKLISTFHNRELHCRICRNSKVSKSVFTYYTTFKFIYCI